MKWFKGNTHAHTKRSDGDSSPDYVAQWYKDHGYQFLVLTDHYTVTVPESSSSIEDSSFLLIPGGLQKGIPVINHARNEQRRR
jgi:predicted metal-dependent phosphoesterase TrpH